MVSNEERREVARKLRDPSELLNIRVPLFEALDMRPDVAETLVSSEVIEHNNRRLLNRLADLIDRPACRNEDGFGRSFLCSACGYEAWTYDDSGCDPKDFSFPPQLRRGGGRQLLRKVVDE